VTDFFDELADRHRLLPAANDAAPHALERGCLSTRA
jgi:hypothetical protein